MKSTPTEVLEPELNIVPIDARLEELRQMEATKKKKQFITNWVKK